MPNTETYTATRWAPITPSDTAPFAKPPRAVYVGGAGDVVAKGEDGVSATFPAQSSQTLDIQPTYVMSTGTTATGLVALY